MHSIETILEPYIELEHGVRERMTELFSDTCGLCTACCCRVDICEEAVQSAFLALLLERQERDAESMDDRYGWLDLHGCTLEFGRPPVCYTYFCDELLARLPDEDARWIVRILGRLIEYVGENAYQGWHLVEISEPDDLKGVDVDAIQERLAHAREVFHAIDQYLASGHLGSAERQKLKRIGVTED